MMKIVILVIPLKLIYIIQKNYTIYIMTTHSPLKDTNQKEVFVKNYVVLFTIKKTI